METMRMHIVGTHDRNTLDQLADVASRADRVALMADGHLGYIMPVGGVAAYSNRVSVAGVGFDIACGNAAIRTDLRAETVLAHRDELADEIQGIISFGIGRSNRADDAPTDDPLFDDAAWDAVPHAHRRSLREKARAQLGTVGSGNHYVDVFADRAGDVWIGVHFGSRGLGHTIASGTMALSQNRPWDARGREVEALLALESPLGDAYWSLMNLAGRYAYAGREWVARKVLSILGAAELELVHNHHNFAWRETHGGREHIVVRKGATPAFPGQYGFVGGSMGDDAVILRGSLDPAAGDHQAALLYSTVHGAGRVMSRTEAAGKRRFRKYWACGDPDCAGERDTGKRDTGPACPVCGGVMVRRKGWQRVREGRISPEMMAGWLAERNVVLRGSGLDEAPHAYRRLPDVLAAQGDTVEVVEVLRPLIVVMAGESEFDPYRD